LYIHGAKLIKFGHQLRDLAHTVAELLAELVVILVFISFELGISLLQELYLVLKLAQVCLALAHLVDLMLKLGD
jgi:hypothetical protein